MLASIHIAQSLQKALDGLLGFIPNLIGFLVILLVGYFIARLVTGVITKVLQKAKLDHALHSGQSGQYVEKLSPGASPSALIGGVVFWHLRRQRVSPNWCGERPASNSHRQAPAYQPLHRPATSRTPTTRGRKTPRRRRGLQNAIITSLKKETSQCPR